MGNRSRFVAAGALAATVVATRRRRRERKERTKAVLAGIGDAILPSQVEPTYDAPAIPDPGEAPGHRHVAAADRGTRSPRRLLGRGRVTPGERVVSLGWRRR